MTLFKHEMRQGKVSLIIWTLAIGLLMVVCIFLFPEMKGEMEGVSKIFASMGAFTAAWFYCPDRGGASLERACVAALYLFAVTDRIGRSLFWYFGLGGEEQHGHWTGDCSNDVLSESGCEYF